MLHGRRRTPEPTIIGNGNEQLRARSGKSTHFARKNGLVTNERSEFAAGNFSDAINRPGGEVGNIGGQASGESEPWTQWNVLAERNQVNFIIGINSPAQRAEEHGAIGGNPVFLRVLFPVHYTNQKISACFPRDAHSASGKSSILQAEWR